MAFIDQHSENDATGTVARVYQASRARTGGIANIVRVMSSDGPSMKASVDLYAVLMKAGNSLFAARREMLATVVSNANDCYY